MGQRQGSLEKLGMNPSFWQNKSVFLTGHTGFKGSWLSLWLQKMGAKVHGYALAPATDPSLFEVARVQDRLAGHQIGDLLDVEALTRALKAARPKIVLHLAAQSLVRRSYQQPLQTYATNVLGTATLLEAVRACSDVAAVVSVTSDKCYDNREWLWGYREIDGLGGHDPYSSSKACAELVTAAYRSSFLEAAGVAVASARAGNVIGGGDWAEDRLLPDFFRALDAGRTLEVRHPEATRPWQHVLEPLAGYLALAQKLVESPRSAAQAWNFGPGEESERTVHWILDYLGRGTPAGGWQHVQAQHPHEARMLKLDSCRARDLLGWMPRWNIVQALDRTRAWHESWRARADMRQVCNAQIDDYSNAGTRDHAG